MPGTYLRLIPVVVFLLSFPAPTSGGPLAPADSPKVKPPQRTEGLKGLRQRLYRKRNREIEQAMIAIALQSLLVSRSPLDNMPLVNPGSRFTFNMPIAKPDPRIDYKMLSTGMPSVPDIKTPIQPRARPYK